ncbi:MAG: response regulator [Bdellovibrionaceae bacterium]|nr:response regulator [Pseudobdellovibrionaceae bacterium]
MKKKVLVVEDEIELRTVLCDLLDYIGLEVTEAENGLIAIEKLKANRFDVIISDLRMPKCTGLEVLNWVRTQKIGTPFIIQTGHGEPDLSQKTANLGVFAILEKPWDHQYLMDIVKKAITSKPAA